MSKEQIFNLISQRRAEALRKADETLKNALLDKAFNAADKEVRRLTIEAAKQKAQGGNVKDAEAALAHAEAERKAALKNLGIKPSDLKPQYTCKKCGDTGYDGNNLCACASKLINETLTKSSGMGNLPKAYFSDFNPALYPEGRQRSEITKLYALMKDYCSKFPDTKYRSILLIGATGLGKTQLICSVANELISMGRDVLYLTAFGLNNLMLKAHTTFDDSRSSILNGPLGCSLLIIDDLGTEPIFRNVTEEYLLSIINERTLSGKHTLISTNLPLGALNTRYGTRLVSRLTDKAHSFTYMLSGEDVRLKKAAGTKA